MLRFVLLLLLGFATIKGKAQLLITQYYEGNSNDKYLELTNMSTVPIDLAAEGIYVYLFANERADDPASNTASLGQALSGIIPPLRSKLYKNGLAAEPAYAAANGQGANFCGFNGDDLVVVSTAADGLSTAGTAWNQRVDVVGDGTNWGQDVSYYRNADVVVPNTTFTRSEWTSASTAVVGSATATEAAYLGFHVSVLPVQLTDFWAEQSGQAVAVKFVVRAERNNAYFALERSRDGQAFHVLAHIPGRGDAEEEVQYSWVDEQPWSGWNYYRLRQVDADGRQQFYGPIATRVTSLQGSLRVGPVPTQEVVYIARSHRTVALSLWLRNANGQALVQIQWPPGEDNLELDLRGYSPGVYWLSWLENGQWCSQQLIKQ